MDVYKTSMSLKNANAHQPPVQSATSHEWRVALDACPAAWPRRSSSRSTCGCGTHEIMRARVPMIGAFSQMLMKGLDANRCCYPPVYRPCGEKIALGNTLISRPHSSNRCVHHVSSHVSAHGAWHARWCVWHVLLHAQCTLSQNPPTTQARGQ
jgi:hypothetical protein